MMKIVIIGAGAMGSLFGGLLAEAGAEVVLVHRGAEHVRAINDHGLSIEQDGRFRRVSVAATTDPLMVGKADWIIIFVKSHQTDAATRTTAQMTREETLVLTLQNGLGNAEIIAGAIGADRVVAGTTAHGATLLGPGRIRHAGNGPTRIGMWNIGRTDRIQPIVELFNASGIQTETVEDIRSIIWSKLLINVGINAITALAGIKNGQILNLEATRTLCRTAVQEAAAVASAHGIRVPENAAEQVLEVAAATGPNRSSMGQDVDRKNQTEIDAINGAVVRQASRYGIATPVNQTLTALIHTLQAHYKSD